eukprot:CAMPEP_0116877642 /NCGR_PEP_ID=MMETSP0463-20121206/9397_1 /TAXON_ID=181622 /ORGANISM="Strombidinopsis sp, Strain SopsisLIS2011" /LENGTH=76 /DNA_ID=CAMNT_0004525077 /DNA_START=650 /DNA_END=880 /DNA_ORIENTATION=-
MNQENVILILLVLDISGKWKPIEQVIHLLEDTIRIVDVFAEARLTLISETTVLVHSSVFVVTSKQKDLFGILQLKS